MLSVVAILRVAAVEKCRRVQKESFWKKGLERKGLCIPRYSNELTVKPVRLVCALSRIPQLNVASKICLIRCFVYTNQLKSQFNSKQQTCNRANKYNQVTRKPAGNFFVQKFKGQHFLYRLIIAYMRILPTAAIDRIDKSS